MSRAVPVSVVVCTRNRPQLLDATIRSVLAADVVPAEIVVVDQSDAPSARSDGAGVRVVRSAPRGLGGARNEGAAAARHELLVFIDDDMEAHPRWLEALVGQLRGEDDRTVATGAVKAGTPESWHGFTPATQQHEPGAVFEGRLDRDVLAGGHMAITRAALDDVGGFDERLGAGARYPAADDNDLGFRLLERGYRIVYVADAVLYHRAWRPGWRYPIVRWRYGRGKGGFYAKHWRTTNGHMRRRVLRDVGGRIGRLPRLALAEPPRAFGDLVYIAGVLAGGVEWWTRERG